ncbi:hypothetical protein HK405_004737 [Cladochytrium tenue]|nr:hypothetical protein HK405_004737 [Cladochytrium tenue]
MEKKDLDTFVSHITTFEILVRESLKCPGVLVALLAILCCDWAVRILEDAILFTKDLPELSQSILGVFSFMLDISAHFSRGARAGRMFDLKNALVQVAHQAFMATFVFISDIGYENMALYVPWLRLATALAQVCPDDMLQTIVELVHQSFRGLEIAPRCLAVILPALHRLQSVLAAERPELAPMDLSVLERHYQQCIEELNADTPELPSRSTLLKEEPQQDLIVKLETLGAREMGWLPSNDEVRREMERAASAGSSSRHLATHQAAIDESLRLAEFEVSSAVKHLYGIHAKIGYLGSEPAKPMSIGVLDSMYIVAEKGQLKDHRSRRRIMVKIS